MMNEDLKMKKFILNAVYDDDDTTCVGFTYSRGRRRIEAFDRDRKSIGFFSDQAEAAEAVRDYAYIVAHPETFVMFPDGTVTLVRSQPKH
jgi:hypothetical protein